MSQTETAPAEDPGVPPDPILGRSYALPIALAMLAVVAATVLAIADEMWWRRPYKGIQGQYKEVYGDYLARVAHERRDFLENVLLGLDEYKSLDEKARAEAEASAAEAARVDRELRNVTQQARRLSEALRIAKSEIAALTYRAGDAAHAAGHARIEDSPEARGLLDEISRIQARQVSYAWPAADDPAAAETERSDTGTVKELLAKNAHLEEEKARLQQVLGRVTGSAGAAKKARDEWLQENLGSVKYALQQAQTQGRKDAILKKIAEVGAARFLERDVAALAPDIVESLKARVDAIPTGWAAPLRGDIRQIHIADASNWVDRCETCHLNAREPLPVTVEGLRAKLSQPLTIPPADPGDPAAKPTELPAWTAAQLDAAPLALFTSHPNPELLAKHDPERFGCSMCHNGNGVAITSAQLAHGQNKHWLFPLHPRENVEAGCLQCHQQDLVLPTGPRISAAKESFRRNGCWGCHKYEGFNREPELIGSIEGKVRALDASIEERQRRRENLDEAVSSLSELEGDELAKAAPDKERRAAALTQEIATTRTEIDGLRRRLRDAYVERQRVGPNLKDSKVKLRPEFFTEWVRSPRDAHKDAEGRAFRPDTKMPSLRWWDDPDEEVRDVSAFLWQSAYGPEDMPEYRLPKFTPGDAAKGEELFKTVGCLSCHSIGTGSGRIGSDYAANLSNLGEKNTAEYVMRWISDPRRRLAAWDPVAKKDVAGARADDPSLVWTQHTAMPNFRLSEQEARDVTTYLVAQRRPGVRYAAAPWLEDESRFERGKKLVLYQGCAGCHEIRGLEEEKGIGTELTQEGSKPLDLLDFGHHTTAAERGEEPLSGWKALEDGAEVFSKEGPWYRPRGFFMHKLAEPDVYDVSKFLPDRFARLRMPQFRLGGQELHDLTTFLLGSVDSKIPESFRYRPDEAGQVIREGWWVVRKYNCQGCHTVTPGEEPSLWKVPFFAEKLAKAKDQFLPPTLVNTGFRTQPDWLARFLRDPSLGGGRERPKSLRAHLPVRMPTFELSEDEVRKLVRFFDALAKQQPVWQKPDLAPLAGRELAGAAAIWKAANCMQCHVVDGMQPTAETKAPNLSRAPQRLRPEYLRRWIPRPDLMQPGTGMTKFFGEEPGPDGRWRYMPQSAELPELRGLPEDHVELMVRYVMQGHAGK